MSEWSGQAMQHDLAGRVALLVNNAGLPLQRATLENCPPKVWGRRDPGGVQQNVHTRSTFTTD